jgi:hypothetical protein
LQYSCKKDSKNSVTEEDLAGLKSYAYFLPGTFWIYEDNQGNIDSMYVISASTGYDSTHDGEYFVSKWHSTFDTYDYLVEWNTSWTSYYPTRHQVFMTKLKPGDYIGQIILLEYPFVEGNILYGDDGGIITSSSYFETMNIQSNSFNKVIKMNNTVDITNNKQKTNYYIAKNVGIIQEELIDSSNVWKLIRYNIVQ